MRTHCALLALLLSLTMTAAANVVFPAFSAPYVAQFFFPFALLSVFVVELAVYKWRCQSLALTTLAVLVVAANAISWLAGFLITAGLLPSGQLQSPDGVVAAGPNFSFLSSLGFVVAYVLSVVIEGAVLKIATRWVQIKSPYQLSLLANTASYVVLSILVWAQK